MGTPDGAPLNFLALRGDIETRFDTGATIDGQVKKWVNQAQQEIWQAAEWEFKRIGPTQISAVASRSQIGKTGDPFVIPTDFMTSTRLFMDDGSRLTGLPDDVFDDIYLPGILQSQNGTPEAFKVNNGQIYVGPLPSVSTTYWLTYERRLSTLTAALAVQAGPLVLDTDIPLWRDDHHEILVFGGMKIGMRTESDLGFIGIDELYTNALQAMIEDLEVDEGGTNREYGADDLGYSVPRA